MKPETTLASDKRRWSFGHGRKIVILMLRLLGVLVHCSCRHELETGISIAREPGRVCSLKQGTATDGSLNLGLIVMWIQYWG